MSRGSKIIVAWTCRTVPQSKVRSTRNSGDAYQSRDDLPELPVRFCGQGEGENLCQSKNNSYHCAADGIVA